MKIDRSAFLYMAPQPPRSRFAQCGTCLNFIPGKRNCTVLGPRVEVTASMSCGLYVHGKPSDDQVAMSSTTPNEAGLVNREVRCENCRFFDRADSDCDLYEKLNETMPDAFKLNTAVDPQACCNAQTPRGN